MTTTQIIEVVKKHIIDLADENNYRWFYDLHQKEVAKSAEELLVYYPDANKEVVMLACWLHDIIHYTAKTSEEIIAVKKLHHINGAIETKKILDNIGLDEETTEKVMRCIERHRNSEGYKPETIEEKIVAAADTYSHFRSIFYLTYFKFHPEDSIERMVQIDLEKLERDWRDLQIIPEAAKMAENRYFMLKEMLNNYNN